VIVVNKFLTCFRLLSMGCSVMSTSKL